MPDVTGQIVIEEIVPVYLSTGEVAKICGCSIASARRMIKAGRLGPRYQAGTGEKHKREYVLKKNVLLHLVGSNFFVTACGAIDELSEKS